MKPQTFINSLINNKLLNFSGVPCSVFKDLINYIEFHEKVNNYTCSSEGEAMGIAAGIALSDNVPVVYMQNDGYGNAINPLSSLQLMYKLPALLLISWRAKPGMNDAPQHKIMGDTIRELLSVFSIPYSLLLKENDSPEDLNKQIKTAFNHFNKQSTPYAFIIEKGYFEKFNEGCKEKLALYSRLDYLEKLSEVSQKDDILLGATGFSGRELYQTSDIAGKFYMMGSMGCLASIGLGIAKSFPDRRIFVLDGDGALLMKMGTLSTVGFYKPENFVHICFDNQVYESTGGQKTTSSKCNFPKIAKECGYNESLTINNPDEFKKYLLKFSKTSGPVFLHIPIKQGTIKDLKRPNITPVEMKLKFMDSLKK